MGEWTTVVASIYQKNGSLTVNDGPPVTGYFSTFLFVILYVFMIAIVAAVYFTI